MSDQKFSFTDDMENSSNKMESNVINDEIKVS